MKKTLVVLVVLGLVAWYSKARIQEAFADLKEAISIYTDFSDNDDAN